MARVRKILLRNGKQFVWREGDLHTNFGMVKEEDLEKTEGKVKSNTDKEFIVLEANFVDAVGFMKRGPQMPLIKDIAVILYYSGIDRNSNVVDAGTGSGLLAISLARVAKKVVSYEFKEAHFNLAKKNLESFELDNLELKNKDISLGIDEKDLDLITLDLPEPWKVIEHASSALKRGGTLVTYLPSIKQVERLIIEAKENNFVLMKTVEILEREWIVRGEIVRPCHDMYGHTAFLTFLRKR